MTFGKRQLVAGALVLALGTAVYLNWQFSQNEVLTVDDTSSTETKQLGQATYVNTAVSDTESSLQESKSSENSTESSLESSGGEASSTETESSKEQTADEIFAQERANREKVYEESVALLSDILESAASDSTAKAQAVAEAAKIAAQIKAESDMETMIKSKGFEDCFVFINNESCSVIVTKGALNENTAMAIKDIVNSHGGIAFDKITVSEV